MNSVAIADYIPRKDTFSRDKKILQKIQRDAGRFTFRSRRLKRENLLSLNLTEVNIEQVEKI